jgi:hypothetical protein
MTLILLAISIPGASTVERYDLSPMMRIGETDILRGDTGNDAARNGTARHRQWNNAIDRFLQLELNTFERA